ncbi:hypothetical protein MA16_Dca022779 [Dendrobium catenatum]|uniref:Uncharacterized protein n=1 Tax=Dendrobium catenatum TaxID=906689 RepID=A0A2I0WL18_9ASPA|nr:hypothetical protein MA16_Dca022779 [Dendrobium catenatum]
MGSNIHDLVTGFPHPIQELEWGLVDVGLSFPRAQAPVVNYIPGRSLRKLSIKDHTLSFPKVGLAPGKRLENPTQREERSKGLNQHAWLIPAFGGSRVLRGKLEKRNQALNHMRERRDGGGVIL